MYITLQKAKKEERSMKWGISSLEELEEMKAKMDQAWHELFEENRGKQDWIEQWFEKLPKGDGTKKTLPSRPKKTTNPVRYKSVHH
jgi:hypothetical protein